MGSKGVQALPRAQLELPPGFRFFPTDEELVVHYLCNKVVSHDLPALIIAEVDLYKYDPWQLPEKAVFGEKEWYFFTPRDRKYPNGSRPNRAAGSGYWKATGADKPITTCGGSKRVGVKKALVFYSGKAPKGFKTNWIMHEYRLAEINPTKNMGTLRLDDWVLCRIYNKKSSDEKISKEKNSEAPDIHSERKNLPIDHQLLSNMENSEPSSDASSKNCNAASSHHHGGHFLQGAKSNTDYNNDHDTFRSHSDDAPIQIPELNCFMNIRRMNYNICNSAEAEIPGLRGNPRLSSDRSPERDSEDVRNGLRSSNFNIQRQDNTHVLGAQPLPNFNFNVEGLQSPFLQQLQQSEFSGVCSPYQEYIDSLTAPGGCLQKSYQSDMLLL